MYTFKNIDDLKIEKCPKTKSVRSFFGKDFLGVKPSNYNKLKTVQEICQTFLEDNKENFKLSNITYKQIRVCEGSKTKSVTYQQIHNGVETENYIVIGLNKETLEIISTINQIDYEIPSHLEEKLKKIEPPEVLDILNKSVSKYAKKTKTNAPKLLIYKHTSSDLNYKKSEINEYMFSLAKEEEKAKENEFYLAWQVLLDVESEHGYWEFFIDATNEKIINVKDRRQYNEYVSCPGKAFIPDPVTSSGDKDIYFTDLKTPEEIAGQLEKIKNESKNVVLQNLQPPKDGKLKLNGRWIESKEILNPPATPPKVTNDFVYEYGQPEFQSVMAYYWIDTFIEYLRKFNVVKYNERTESTKINIDAHAGDSFCHYTVQESLHVVFDDVNVPDATDAHVVIHEYSHAIHWYMEKPQEHELFGIEEGVGDFLAGVWLDRFNIELFNREKVLPWAGNKKIDNDNSDSERVFNITKKFSDPGYNSYGTYVKGSILATALWNVYLSMGGGDLENLETRKEAADKLIYMYLEMLVSIAPNVSVQELVRCLINTDEVLFGGANRGHITKAFRNQGLTL